MNSTVASMLVILTCLFLWSVAGENSSKSHPPLTVKDTTGTVEIPINTEVSRVIWMGTEMWETGKHEGTLSLSEGYLLMKNRQIEGGRFIADMHTIDITDIPESDPIPRKRLRNHLESEDFFYVEKFPAAEFEITKTEAINGDSLRVWGDLSIRDITNPISFIATREVNKDSGLVINAAFKIDRFEYNISYQGSYWKRISSILDNTFVDAEISLSVELVITGYH